MAEESEAVVRELSTLSTPPTVRTSVETDNRRTILEPSASASARETRGESEGGKKPSADAATGALDPAWARALHSRAACAIGHCAYADPTKRPNRHIGSQGCDGYQASRSTEPDGRVTVRWGLCPRHQEWWRLERIRQRAAKVVRMPHPGIGPER